MNMAITGRINTELSLDDLELTSSTTEIELTFIDSVCINILADLAKGFYIHYKTINCGDFSACAFKVKFL